jgi:hypothetical protein
MNKQDKFKYYLAMTVLTLTLLAIFVKVVLV